MKKSIVAAIVIVVMIIAGILIGLPYTVRMSEKPGEDEITWFRYSVGNWTAMEYVIERDGDQAHLTAKRYVADDIDETNIMIDADCLTELAKIINDNGIYKWNGFDKSDKDVTDGDGFSLKVIYGNGRSIEAHGYMKYPSGYEEASAKLTEYLKKLCEEAESEDKTEDVVTDSVPDPKEPEEPKEPEVTQELTESEQLYQAFINDEIPAIRIRGDGTEATFMYSDLPHDPGEWDNVTVSDEKVDLDNDGENELLLNGAYGGMYLDARDGKVYVLAEGEGTALQLGYAEYEGLTYVVHRDTSHSGRNAYNLDKYNGKGEIEDSFQLAALYWDSEYDMYDQDSEFIFRDKNITMEEYEALVKEILDIPSKLEWAKSIANNDINYPETDKELVKNDGSEAFMEKIGEFAGEYTYVKDKDGLAGTLSIRMNELGYDINDNNTNGYRFLSNDGNVEYIQGNRLMLAYPDMVYADGEAVFKNYLIVRHKGYLSVFETDEKYENPIYIYTAWVKY